MPKAAWVGVGATLETPQAHRNPVRTSATPIHERSLKYLIVVFPSIRASDSSAIVGTGQSPGDQTRRSRNGAEAVIPLKITAISAAGFRENRPANGSFTAHSWTSQSGARTR